MQPIEAVLEKLDCVRRNGTGWLARCPAHDDKSPSLSVGEGDDGRVLLRCFAGCSADAICEAMGIKTADLFTKNNGSPRKARKSPPPPKTFPTAAAAVESLERQLGKRAASWTYHDSGGNPVGLALRWDKPDGTKDIRPVSRHGDGWQCKGMTTPRPLYRLPELSEATTVYISEGEKAADALAGIGLVATTSAHGGNAAKGTDWKPLAGKTCIVLPDNDKPGQRYADDVVGLMAKLSPAPTIKVVTLLDLPGKGDAADYIASRRDAGVDDDDIRGEIESLVDAAEVVKPEAKVAPILQWRPFPTASLPEPLRGLVAAVAVAMQCDESFVALPLLSGLASAIGTTRIIRLRRTWCEKSILWTCIVGESGTVKSPAIELALKPIRKRQRKARRRHAEEMKEYRVVLAEWKGDKARRNQEPEPEPPAVDRCIVGDVTPEALSMLLEQNPRGLLVARDELAGWLAFDRYSKARSECSFWLELFGGRELPVDRKTTASVDVQRSATSLTGGIQPATLERALGQEHLQDGLAARLLLAMPPRKTKQWSEQDVPARTEEAVALVFDRLYELSPNRDEDGEPCPKALPLTAEGQAVWVRFYNEHAKEQREHVGAMAAALSKLEGYCARIAMVIHLVRVAAGDSTVNSPDVVDAKSIEAAVVLVRWFGHEAGRLYAAFSETPEDAESRELVDWIRGRGGVVSVRDVARNLRRFRGDSEAAKGALDELVEAGLGSWTEPQSSKGGGRPSRRFRLADTADADETPTGDTVAGGFVTVGTVGTPENTFPAPEDDGKNEPVVAPDDDDAELI